MDREAVRLIRRAMSEVGVLGKRRNWKKAGAGARPASERWSILLAPVAALGLFFAVGCGGDEVAEPEAPEVEVAETPKPPRPKDGLWIEYRPEMHAAPDFDAEALEELSRLGYFGGVNLPEGGGRGVVYLDAERAFPGLNLISSADEAEAYLMTNDGRRVWTWAKEFDEAFPAYPHENALRAWPFHTYFWRHAHVFPNGDLIGIYERLGMVKLDKDSNIIWTQPNFAHHDLDVAEDGRIWALTEELTMMPEYFGEAPVAEDFVSLLSAEGETLERFSIWEALLESEFGKIVWASRLDQDLLHTNSIQILDGTISEKIPAFEAGNLLLSFRNIDLIAVLDPETREFVWGMQGPFKAQHSPRLLESGHILMFDNQGGDPDLGGSRALEFDPVTGEIVWEYGGTVERTFFSSHLGFTQRLPNGNTLLTESTRGRAYEVTPDQEIVWEFVNPARAGENDEFIALLCDIMRFEKSFVESWLPEEEVDTADQR